MYRNNLYENRRLKDRLKDLLILASFTVSVAVLSTAVMDIIVFPISLFAVEKKELFTIVVKDILFYMILAFLIFFLALKVLRLKKDGLGAMKIIRYLFFRPMYYLAVALFLLICTSIIGLLLYMLISNNFYLLYTITN